MVRAAVFVLAFCLLTAAALADDDTNAADIQAWFKHLTNHMHGSCCGEGDAYPAEIEKDATPNSDGVGHVTDPRGKEVWVDGRLLKTKKTIVGNLHFRFKWHQVTQEADGNPFNHAEVFLHLDENGQVMRSTDGPWYDGVYCVAPLQNSY